MRRFGLEKLAEAPSFLFLGAHCDDIEIGVGGTIRRLVNRYPDGEFTWVTFSSSPVRALETQAASGRLLDGARRKKVIVQSFRESYFPFVGTDIKDYFETLKGRVSPDVIFTHCGQDRHQDHRVIHDLTWSTFRNHSILEYEIPKYDGDLGSPNVFVAISAEDLDMKVRILMDCFPSQRHRSWFTEDTFRSLARLRAIEANAESGFAEAFYCRKALLDF